jgi:uncharacterized protein YkwD
MPRIYLQKNIYYDIINSGLKYRIFDTLKTTQKMILKITSGISKKQKLTILGFVLLIALSLVISYLINQSTKPSKANSPSQVIATSSILIKSESSSTSITNSSLSSTQSLSSSIISSSSSSEAPKLEKEKPKEEIKPELIIEKITKIDTPIIPKPELIKTAPIKIQEPVYETQTPEVVVPQPKIETPTPKPEPVVIQQPVVEKPKPTISFSSNTCNQGMIYELLNLVNDHRLANGAGTLTLAADLNNVACSHAQWMNETGNFSHTGKDGTNPYQRCDRAGTVCWAENVAYDSQIDVQNIFEMYKNSPGHNKNMINPEYTEIGLAFEGIYNAQVFR